MLLQKKNNAGSADEFFLVTAPESSGSPPRRPPPLVPDVGATPILSNLSISEPIENEPIEESRSLSKSQSLSTSQAKELTVDDIDEFDDDIMEEIESHRYSRRVLNDASDVVLGLPSFSTGRCGWWWFYEPLGSSYCFADLTVLSLCIPMLR